MFAVSRRLFDHPFFANEPFTEREAWVWLLADAAWKPRQVRGRHGVVELQRGQLAHSTRFMAAKWQWSEARVRRFLKRLKSDAMIDAQGDAQTTRITICKYNEYQKVSLPSDADNDAPSDGRSTRARRKEENIQSREEKEEPYGSSKSAGIAFRTTGSLRRIGLTGQPDRASLNSRSGEKPTSFATTGMASEVSGASSSTGGLLGRTGCERPLTPGSPDLVPGRCATRTVT
ncbi:hypothetical protein ACHMW7_28425 [Aminobacter sp. UC22_36]|uniref:hypothetical protein n=1 Tax=Aminobacter sp. UC22_36 TaxID=3374549 RepID=UPI003756A224